MMPPEPRPQAEPREHPAPAQTETRPELQQTPEHGGIAVEKEGFLDEAIEGLKRRLKQPKKKKPTHIPQVRDEVTVQVEKIMEAGLAEAFQAMTPIQQQEFKIKGEETAMKIRDLLRGTRVKVKKIFQLLVEWLKMIPGVNKFFLEQEAKIKADKLMNLKQVMDAQTRIKK